MDTTNPSGAHEPESVEPPGAVGDDPEVDELLGSLRDADPADAPVIADDIAEVLSGRLDDPGEGP
jgi:hypothetical protein